MESPPETQPRPRRRINLANNNLFLQCINEVKRDYNVKPTSSDDGALRNESISKSSAPQLKTEIHLERRPEEISKTKFDRKIKDSKLCNSYQKSFDDRCYNSKTFADSSNQQNYLKGFAKKKSYYPKYESNSVINSHEQIFKNSNEYKEKKFNKSYDKCSYNTEKYTDKKGIRPISNNIKKNVGDYESVDVVESEDQTFENIVEFGEIKHKRVITGFSNKKINNSDKDNFKILLKNDMCIATNSLPKSDVVHDLQKSKSFSNSDSLPACNKPRELLRTKSLSDSHNSAVLCVTGEIATDEKNCSWENLPVANDIKELLTKEKHSNFDLPVSDNVYDLQTSKTNSDLSCAQIFPSGDDDFIPPPVECHFIGNSMQDVSNIPPEKCPLEKANSDSAHSFGISEDESYFALPDSEQIEAVSNFISTVVKEKSVSQDLVIPILRELNAIFRDQFDGYTIELYGSFSNDLAISTSNINFVMKTDCSVRKSFMFEVYKVLSKESKYYVYPYEDGTSAYQIKISFAHQESGVRCQLVYLGKNESHVLKMGLFLRKVSSYDERIKKLIIATKLWSECLSINDVEDGKLHPVGYALMVIHFLQHCENPMLPNFPCNHGDVEILPPNESSIGELWLSFLKYYAVTFNWKQHVIAVNSEDYVSKKSKGWENYWIAVEDPFTQKNIAKSVVNSDIADYIRACFKSSFEYFCSPPEISISCSSNDEEENYEDSVCPKLQFSFQQCIAEQSDTFCEMCDELMDICDECQSKLYVQPMSSLPKMTDSFLELIRNSLRTVYEKYILTENEINERKEFVKELERNLRRRYPDADLNLFGSSANGFGFKNSDLDICMTFRSKKVMNSTSVLKDVRYLLRKDKNFDHVLAIFSAQIPIVKFHYQPKGWRGDISLDNTLAIHNSELLYTYSLIDERCKILGCALKLLAKKALIAEVTEKALSSYSYLNMVIHFLQQTEPPVLPVLQDNKLRKNYKIDDIIEGYNIWFCKDLEYIREVFKAENKTPVEQLWLDLLDYYCSYDSNKFISIRQKEPLFMCENKRSARLFNIQDPFIETKNLGCVVSAKKAHETKSVLCRARQLFRTPVKELPTCVKDIEDFFFSTQSLTGRIHKEVHCDLCGKFGHEKNDCRQTYFPPRRNFFFQQRYANRNSYKNRNQINRRPCYRGPNWKQPVFQHRQL